MYKVAIIEDEPIMRKYLSKCLNWNDLNLELCGVYANKETALRGITENRMDIVITDIKLPDSDGLTLMSDVLKVNPAIQFVVISAYSDFENVKKAFKIGAVDYILKTEFEPKHLEQILYKIVQRIDVIRKKETGSFKAFLEKENLLKKIFWSNDFGVIDREDIKWRIHGDFKDFSIGVIKLLNYKSIAKKWKSEKELIKYGIYNIVEELLGEAGHGEFFFNSYDEIVFLFDSLAEDKGNKIQNIISILCKEFGFVTASGVCTIDITKSMAEEHLRCTEIADYSFIIGRNIVVGERDVINSNSKFDVMHYTNLFEEKLRACEYKEIIELLDELVSVRPQMESIRTMQDFFYACLIALFRYSKECDFKFIDYEDIYSYVLSSDISGIIEYMKTAVLYFEKVGLGKLSDIKNVENYIINNYNKDINLKNIAEKLCFEYSYFSKKFLKKTGKTFKQYLTDVRLENAYRLIMNTTHSMSKIAEMVGYKSYDNFSRNFTQKYGKRPTEIRKEI